MELRIRPLTEQDFPFAEILRSLAGWNQTENDWKRYLLCQPDGCFLAELSGTPVATLTTTCFQEDLAWIGMVLVHPDYRRRGVARALMLRALEFLDQKGIRGVKLDATPQGKPLYEQLGFCDEWTMHRWKAEAWCVSPVENPPCTLRPLEEEDWLQIVPLDTRAFGVPREPLLKVLARQSDRVLVAMDTAGRILGYGMVRKGMVAGYLGPLVASSFSCVPALIASLTAGCSGRPLFWDIPDSQREAIPLARAGGMQPLRELVRMYRHANLNPGNPEMQWGISDPATG